uniref:Uncharacterized protein n=1 Tax=Eutreptiella gymnastica TaxID=73025 RepID=A0A7S4CUU0_9EUGL
MAFTQIKLPVQSLAKHREAPHTHPLCLGHGMTMTVTPQNHCGIPRIVPFIPLYLAQGKQSIPSCAEVPSSNMQSNVPLACQACFQQFKRNRNGELATGTKRNMVRQAQT